MQGSGVAGQLCCRGRPCSRVAVWQGGCVAGQPCGKANQWLNLNSESQEQGCGVS